MTDQAKRAQYQADFTTDKARELKRIMFEDRSGLAKFFAERFNIQFTAAQGSTVYYIAENGKKDQVDRAFSRLIGALTAGNYISKDLIKNVANEINPTATGESELSKGFKGAANQNTKVNSKFVPKTQNQADFAEMIDNNDFSFGVGPAGTGKTHVAMMKAVEALRAGQVKKILLSRPAQESGERIGFLPGDQNEKLAPYMRPLYDELDKAFGMGAYKKMIDQGVIEICPVGFMRGRTFENAFVILDEAQNCSKEQIKMAVTRLGEGSKMVITGDPMQVDLTPKSSSGLQWLVDELEGIEGISIMKFKTGDIVRHPTVKRLLDKIEGDFAAVATPQAITLTEDAPAAPKARRRPGAPKL